MLLFARDFTKGNSFLALKIFGDQLRFGQRKAFLAQMFVAKEFHPDHSQAPLNNVFGNFLTHNFLNKDYNQNWQKTFVFKAELRSHLK